MIGGHLGVDYGFCDGLLRDGVQRINDVINNNLFNSYELCYNVIKEMFVWPANNLILLMTFIDKNLLTSN